ncbi:c2H2-type zinc-finger domain-containing protein [Ditylenchus destructor]|nr:c2H2-type zinc-finger domain-containing protein [Ditylenchus destructor]
MFAGRKFRNGRVSKRKKRQLHKCDQCSYISERTATLDRHMRTHTGEKPFKCEQCSYINPERYSKRAHSGPSCLNNENEESSIMLFDSRGPKSQRLSVLNRKAVGGGIKFDTFYNARLDCFIDETSPVKTVKQEAAMDLMPKSQSDWNLSHIYNCSLGEVDVNSRFSQLGVDSDHKASILSGLTKIDGFWKYLTDVDVETSKEKSFTLVRTLQTKKTLPEINKAIFAKLLMPGNSIEATHVVTSVTHGVILASVFYCDDGEGIDFETVKKLTLDFVKGISIRSDFNTLQSMGKQLKVRVYADPMFQLAEEMNFKDAIGLMKTMDKLLKRTPDGLGHCLEFDLSPLKHFIGPQLLNPINVYTPQTSELDLSTIDKVVALVQQTKSEGLMTDKGYQHLINFGYIFSEEVFKEQQSIKAILADMIHSFEDSARRLMHDIRYESFESVSDLQNAYEHLETLSGILKQKFTEIIDQVDDKVTSKVHFAMELDAAGVTYVGRHNTTFDKELSLIPDDGHCYVLLYTPTDKKTFKEQYKLFKSLFDSKNKCIFIDLEVAERPNFLPSGTRIVKFRGKKPLILNYFEEETLHDTRRSILLLAKPLAVISDYIQTQILDLKDDIDKAELLPGTMENTVCAIKEYESEQVVISEIAARLGSYINWKSVQPSKDAIQACIEQTVKEYEMLALVTDDYQKLEAMKTCLKEYVKQKQIFDNALQSGSLAMDTGDIKKYFDHLISLKLNGSRIKKLFEYEEKNHKSQTPRK